MVSLTVTINDNAVVGGWIEAANRSGTTAAAMATECLSHKGRQYAELFGIGVITSAAFLARFSPAEYEAVVVAAADSPEVAGYIARLVSSERVNLDSLNLRIAVQSLADLQLIAQSRVDEILSYQRPVPQV
jgi:hypothetical protein